MKKIISAISLVLALCCLLALSGCSFANNDNAALVGTWEAYLDLSDEINAGIAEGNQDEPELVELLKVSDFKIRLVYTFNDDDTYSFEGDEDVAQASIDKMIADYKTGLTTYFQKTIDESNLNMTVDELLAMSGTNLDALINDAFANLTAESLISEMEGEGNFEAKEGKLYCSDGLDYAIDEEIYETYELDDDTLTITGGSEEEDPEEQAQLEAMYPMVFTKVK